MSNRKAIPLKTQLAAALLQLVDDKGERLIPHADAKLMTADQVISLFNRDHHPIRVADGGEDVHWNLTWRLRAEHKTKTAKIDQPELGKQRRIRARERDHKAILTMKYYARFGQTRPNAQAQNTEPPISQGRKFASRK